MSKKRTKSEASNVMDVQEFAKAAVASPDMQYIDHLESKLISIQTQLKEAYSVNEQLHSKIKHLEEMLVSLGESKTKFIITPEEEIAELQINRLLEASKTRALSLDETRQYDLLVKNKRLAMSEPTTIEGKSSRVKDVKDVGELTHIARLKLEDK